MTSHPPPGPGAPVPPLMGTHPPRRAFLILGGIMLVLVALMAGVGFAIHAQIEEVESMSARADAEVVRERTVSTGDGHNRYVIFQWTHEGETFEQESRGTNESAEVGDLIRIQFDPDNPKVVGEDGWGSRWGIIIALAFPTALFAGLFLLFGWILLNNLKKLRAARSKG